MNIPLMLSRKKGTFRISQEGEREEHGGGSRKRKERGGGRHNLFTAINIATAFLPFSSARKGFSWARRRRRRKRRKGRRERESGISLARLLFGRRERGGGLCCPAPPPGNLIFTRESGRKIRFAEHCTEVWRRRRRRTPQ